MHYSLYLITTKILMNMKKFIDLSTWVAIALVAALFITSLVLGMLGYEDTSLVLLVPMVICLTYASFMTALDDDNYGKDKR
jgi:hypothetical protein